MCNTAGMEFGIFLGFIFLTMLMSETYWNTWRSSPQPVGLVSLQGIIILLFRINILYPIKIPTL